MVRWRWVAGGLVVALIVGAGAAYGGYRWKLARQRDDYAAGHAAYLRADCAAALPKLTAAQDDHLADGFTARARADATACEKYARTLGQGRPPVRTALWGDVDTGQPDADFCRSRVVLTDQLVDLRPADELGAPWLIACATTLAAEPGGWEYARRTLLELQARFPGSKEAEAGVSDLVRVTNLAAAVYPDARPITGFAGPEEWDDTLGWSARLTFYSQLTTPVDLTVGGTTPQYAHVPACEGCEPSPAKSICRPKPSWKKVVITVPAGRHAVQFWATASDRTKYFDAVGHGRLTFEPGGVYLYCLWE